MSRLLYMARSTAPRVLDATTGRRRRWRWATPRLLHHHGAAHREGQVLVGVGGGEYNIRGFVAAFDARARKRGAFTIPAPVGRPRHLGGGTWKTGGGSTCTPRDPALNLASGTAAPGPTGTPISGPATTLHGRRDRARHGYRKAQVAFQFSPNDTYDYDSVRIAVLADITWRGAPTKTMPGQPEWVLRARSHERKIAQHRS